MKEGTCGQPEDVCEDDHGHGKIPVEKLAAIRAGEENA